MPRRSAREWPRAGVRAGVGAAGQAAGAEGRAAATAGAAAVGAATAAIRGGGAAAKFPRASRGERAQAKVVTANTIELFLPPAERALVAALATSWRDLLYVPGPDFISPLEPALFRSAFVVIPADGPAVRVSSAVMPAFGTELCRVQLEALPSFRAEMLGSFFEPERRGQIYVMSKERDATAARPPDRTGWSYAGPPLAERLGRVERVRILRERVVARLDGQPVGWTADRGLVVDLSGDQPCLLLASARSAEEAIFVPVPRLYRALLGSAAVPGATARELLGYGDWAGDFELALETVGIRAG
jgi:hypothetical protein